MVGEQKNKKMASVDLPPNKKTWESPVKSMFSEARNTM